LPSVAQNEALLEHLWIAWGRRQRFAVSNAAEAADGCCQSVECPATVRQRSTVAAAAAIELM